METIHWLIDLQLHFVWVCCQSQAYHVLTSYFNFLAHPCTNGVFPTVGDSTEAAAYAGGGGGMDMAMLQQMMAGMGGGGGGEDDGPPGEGDDDDDDDLPGLEESGK